MIDDDHDNDDDHMMIMMYIWRDCDDETYQILPFLLSPYPLPP